MPNDALFFSRQFQIKKTVEEAFKDAATTRELADIRRRQNEDHATMDKMNITVVKSASDIETIQRTLPDKVKGNNPKV